jgi:periplasmic copper chaperone A
MRVYGFEIALAAALLSAPAAAAEVTVSDAWIRAMPAQLPAAGYFTIRNTGAKEVVLVSVGTPACGMLMLHKSSDKGGMESMEDVDRVAVPPGGTVSFAPGGYHLMCMQPSAQITPGGNIVVALKFADGSRTVARFAVRNAQGK